MSVHLFLYLTMLSLIANTIVYHPILRLLLYYVIIGGNLFVINKYEPLLVETREKYNLKHGRSFLFVTNLVTHIIWPILLLYSFNPSVCTQFHYICATFIIMLYCTIIDVKDYYYITKKQFLIGSIVLMFLIYKALYK